MWLETHGGHPSAYIRGRLKGLDFTDVWQTAYFYTESPIPALKIHGTDSRLTLSFQL